MMKLSLQMVAACLMALPIGTHAFAQDEAPDPVEAVEPSVTELEEESPTESAPQPPAPVKRWRFGLGIFHTTARNFVFPAVHRNGLRTSETYRSSPAPTIALEATYGAPHAMGIAFGVQVDGDRTVESVEVEAANGTKTTTTFEPGPKVSILSLYANLVYQWDNFYIPFGFSINAVRFKGGGEELEKIVGSTGLNLGVGYGFNEHFSIELLLRSIGMYGPKFTATNGTITEFGVGIHAGVQIGVKAYY